MDDLVLLLAYPFPFCLSPVQDRYFSHRQWLFIAAVITGSEAFLSKPKTAKKEMRETQHRDMQAVKSKDVDDQ